VSRRVFLSAGVVLCLMAAGCQRGNETPQAEVSPAAPAPTETSQPSPEPQLVDPREGGFDVGFGEFAVALEAEAIRPGPVTFVIRNGGELVHGFEMESESEDGDNSGPGGGDDDRFKIERPIFGPGQTIRVNVDLAPGVYKIYCYVADHEELGMVALLEVRPDAPKVREKTAAGTNAVTIQGFAFDPESIEVAAGTEVTWTNQDPAEHTVTAEGGAFDSGPLARAATFSTTLEGPGTVTYFCAIHPSMRGTVRVRG
jgi:plastocyanin